MPRSAISDARGLALLLMGTRARRAAQRHRLAALAYRTDPADLLAVLAEQRLVLLGAARLEAEGLLDERVRHAAVAARAAVVLRNMVHRAATEHVTGALGEAGIKSVLLKGVPLAEELHGDDALRQSSDIDLLVARADLGEAVWRLEQLGYVDVEPVRAGLPRLHHHLRHPEGALPDLDLHWRIHWYEEAFALRLLATSRTLSAGLLVPDRLERLATLLLFYERDGLLGIRALGDISAWADINPSTAGRLGELAAAYPELGRALAAGALAAERLAGLPGSELLGPEGLAFVDRRVELAVRLAGWDLRGDRDQLSANITLVDGLCSPRGGGRAFARRHVVCDSTTLREYYGLPEADRFGLMRRRIAHPPKILGRYALAAVALRGGRSWSPEPGAA
jgi:hypothetical protein